MIQNQYTYKYEIRKLKNLKLLEYKSKIFLKRGDYKYAEADFVRENPTKNQLIEIFKTLITQITNSIWVK